jgi:hypothetical protein
LAPVLDCLSPLLDSSGGLAFCQSSVGSAIGQMVVHDVVDYVISLHDTWSEIFVGFQNTESGGVSQLLNTFLLTAQQVGPNLFLSEQFLHLPAEIVEPVDDRRVNVQFIGGDVASYDHSGVILGIWLDTCRTGVVDTAVDVGTEPCQGWLQIEGCVRWAYAEVQSKAKQGSKCGWWLDSLGEVMDGQILWALEVVPCRHFSKGYSGVLFD